MTRQSMLTRGSARHVSLRFGMLCVLWVVAVVTSAMRAQTAVPDTTRTTLDGVYTTDQADRGQKLYSMSCLGGCHNSTSHKGDAFKKNWGGHLVSELFFTIKENMPDDNPGMLSPNESVDVIGYLLKINGVPAGKDELRPDVDALKKIRIELPAGGTGHTR